MWKLAITVPAEAEEAATELLPPVFGVHPTSYLDLQKHRAVLSFFFPKKPSITKAQKTQIAEVFARIGAAGLLIGTPRLRLGKVAPEDWAESWKKHFKPFEVGRELLIKPSWSKRRPRQGQQVVTIDPGLSFGTGQHPTTSFCLEQLVKLSPNQTQLPASFLDAGTGSAILAIAAAKLGYGPVHAIDFDPVAIRVARANAAENHVQRQLRLAVRDVTSLALKPERRYSVLCANLISNLLIEVRQKLFNRLEPGGTLVIAGILKTEFPEVQKAFDALGLKMTASRAEKEWRSGAFMKAPRLLSKRGN
jgi:ribosomal protein L11 methyltransferase